MEKTVVYNRSDRQIGDCVHGQHFFIDANQSIIVNRDVADVLVGNWEELSFDAGESKVQKEFSNAFWAGVGDVAKLDSGGELVLSILKKVVDGRDSWDEVESDVIFACGKILDEARGGDKKPLDAGAGDDAGAKTDKKQKK
jgi:hypothetical protein